MTTYAVGDSITVGIAQAGGADSAFATESMAARNMGGHFAQALAVVQPGDNVIVSAGYNGGIDAAGRRLLVEQITNLRSKGANVVILGLRETGHTAYPHLNATAAGTNLELDAIAKETGAVFARNTIAVANGIDNGEIHGKSHELAQKALAALGGQSASPTIQLASAQAPAVHPAPLVTAAPSAITPPVLPPAPPAEQTAEEEAQRRRAQTAPEPAAPEQNAFFALIGKLLAAFFGSGREDAHTSAYAQAPAAPALPNSSQEISPDVAAQARQAVSRPLPGGASQGEPQALRQVVAQQSFVEEPRGAGA